MERGLDKHVLSYIGDIDSVSSLAEDMSPSVSNRQVTNFINKLVSFGLLEHQILVLLDRFVYSKTFGEITREHGFVDPRTTHRIYKQALEQVHKAYNLLGGGDN